MSDVAGSGSADASFCAGYPSSSSGGRIENPPGLPLSDLPRVTGAYGVPAYDPDFGLGSLGANVEPKASIPPPPPRDPYVQLLESQSAMSMLMMQMAREINQRSQQLQQPQQQQQGVPNPTPQPSPAARQPIGRLDQLAKCEWTKNGYRQCRCHHGSNGIREEENSQGSRTGWKNSAVGCVLSKMPTDQSWLRLSTRLTGSNRLVVLNKPCGARGCSICFNRTLWATARLRT